MNPSLQEAVAVVPVVASVVERRPLVGDVREGQVCTVENKEITNYAVKLKKPWKINTEYFLFLR